jgi:UMF1 family MFS transporter
MTTQTRGFAAYDWANSGYVTVVTTAVGGPYLDAMSGHRPLVLPLTIVAAVLVQVVLLPLLGRRVDRGAEPVRLVRRFALAGGTATVALALAPHWLAAAAAMATAIVCFGAAMVPYNAILPRLAPGTAADRLSSQAFAVGYVGGGVLLAAALALLGAAGESVGVRLAIGVAGIWWAGFGLLACRSMGEVPAAPTTRTSPLGLLRDLPQLRRAIVGAMVLGDAIGAVVSLSATVLSHEVHASTKTLLLMVLLVQVLAAPFAVLTGRLASRFGTKAVLLGCILGWVAVMVGATTSLHTTHDVWALAVGLAAVLGGSQTLARSLVSQLTPAGSAGAVFSLTQLAERGTAWMGPTLFAVVVGTTGSYRGALASLLVLFAVAAALLSRVDTSVGNDYDAAAAYAARRLALPDASVPSHRGRLAYTGIARLIGLVVRPAVTGTLPDGPVLVVANHVSVADGPALAVAGSRVGRQLRMLGTAGVFTAPLLGRVLLEAGMVPVKRGTSEAGSALRGAQLLLEAGEAVALFPEGRIGDGPVQPHKPGAAVLATRTGCPVVLAVVRGTDSVVPRGTWKPRLRSRCSVEFVPLGRFAGQDVETVRSLLQQAMSAHVGPELALAA